MKLTSEQVIYLHKKALQDYINNKPHYRLGQSYFNTLHDIKAELADSIRATVIDPFYNDDKLPDFILYISELA